MFYTNLIVLLVKGDEKVAVLIINQIKSMIKKREVLVTLLIMFAIILYNYFGNVKKYFGYQISDLPSYLEMCVMSDGNLDMMLDTVSIIPFLAIIPAGFSISKDIRTGRERYWIYRTGRKKFYISKAIATAVVTFLCFFIPLFFETILNVITFSKDAHGNLQCAIMFDDSFRVIRRYYLFKMYFYHPVIYEIIVSLFFSAVMSVFAIITGAVSCYINKYIAFLFLPCYVLINIFDTIKIYGKDKATYIFLAWNHYYVHRSDFILFIKVWGCCVIISALLYALAARKDTL